MPFVSVLEMDYSLFYRVYGEPKEGRPRPRLLFLTGVGGTHTDFKRYADHFAKTCHVCLMDNRGCGFSGTPSRPWRWTTAQMAKDAQCVLDDLGWDDVHVVGYSLGGMVAQELAVLTPKRVNTLTLISTCASVFSVMPSFRQVTSFFQSLVKSQASGYEGLFPDQWLNEERSSDLHNGAVVTNRCWLTNMMFLCDRDVPLELGQEYNRVPPPSSKVTMRQMAAVLTHSMSKHRFDTTKTNDPSLRALVIAGSEDVLVRPLNSSVLSEMTGGELVMVQGAGHGVMLQCEEELRERISKHVFAHEPVDV